MYRKQSSRIDVALPVFASLVEVCVEHLECSMEVQRRSSL